jgi:hypothetical protein
MSGSGAEDARRAFLRDGPALRAALVAELAACVEAAATLSPDEAALIAHMLAHAGLRLDGVLFVPSYGALWGETPSYLPAVALPAERARAAAKTLRRRGLLREDAEGVLLVSDAVRALPR